MSDQRVTPPETGRRLTTEIPGPASRALSERRAAALPRGVGTTPFRSSSQAEAGIIGDVNGDRLIDFGSGISVINAGNSAPAVENAVKVARYATGRSKVFAFDHGFHGRTLLTMSLTGKVAPNKSS